MTLATGRRALTSHPRAVLVVLLALAVELVPPPALLVRHRHGGGEGAHVHAGRIAGVARDPAVDAQTCAPVVDPVLAPALPADLHAHLAPPAVVAAVLAIVPPALAFVVTSLPGVAPSRAIPAVVRSARARAPPGAAA